jgi:hypothetical protein
MGAALDILRQAATTLEIEANGVSDNPLVFTDTGEALSGGNFHAEPVAFAADMLAMAVCEIGSISERRLAMLVDPALSGLPAFLTPRPGLNSGFMIPQVTAAALVSENKQRAYPASVDSIPTSANQEDHVSMAAHGARRLMQMAENAANVIGIELLAAAQGCDFHAAALQRRAGNRARHPACAGADAGRRPLLPSGHGDRHESGAQWRAGAGPGRSAADRGTAGMTTHPEWLTVHEGDAPHRQLPHTGSELPHDLIGDYHSPWLARRDADWWVHELYDFVRGMGATTVRSAISRSVIDLNRDPSGVSLYPGQNTTGLCPLTTFDNQPLYHAGREPDEAEIARRRDTYFLPYHDALAAQITRLRARHGTVVVYDAHSIRSHIRTCSTASCRSSTWALPVRPAHRTPPATTP